MQEPYNHALPSRAEILAAQAIAEKRWRYRLRHDAKLRGAIHTSAVWAFGLAAAGMAGQIFDRLAIVYSPGGSEFEGFGDPSTSGGLGFWVGICAFVCIRLWLTERRPPKA
jgi:hypothetical protein